MRRESFRASLSPNWRYSAIRFIRISAPWKERVGKSAKKMEVRSHSTLDSSSSGSIYSYRISGKTSFFLSFLVPRVCLKS